MPGNALQRIMYIEDESDICEIAKIALEDMGGFTLLFCQSGQEALSKAVTFKPDLFLIDVMMPEMDGPATLRKLHNIPELASIPVIFMTAKAQTSEIKEYLDIGALGVIIKPFDPLQLPSTIKNIWEKK